MNPEFEQINNLIKALNAGSYSGAPGTLVQGAALQIEDLSSTMELVTFEKKAMMLQNKISVETCKSTLAQFNRQLSYGQFGGHAQLEGALGPEDESDYVRITVPMTYYSCQRRVTIASTMVDTVDGKKSDERAAADAAMIIMSDVEFDCFRGMDDFSNGGVYDGNPLSTPSLANMHGFGLQIRQSDFQVNSRDAMFSEFGSDESVVVGIGGVLTQDRIEDMSTRSALNHGDAKTLLIDPVSLSAYNKQTIGKERIILAGSPQDAVGSDLRKQWVSGGTVSIEASVFLRGKSSPARPRIHPNAPAAPTISLAAGGSGGNVPVATHFYFVTTGNEVGESRASAASSQAVTAGQVVTVTVTPSGSGGPHRFYNVYRGLSAATAHFIGRVVDAGTATTDFIDAGNKLPGFVTGYLVDTATAEFRELAPFSRLKLPQTDLTIPEAFFQFRCLAVKQPRKNVIAENIRGQFAAS